MSNSSYSASFELTKHLELLLGTRVDIKINQNRKTMLSVLENNSRCVRLSIHEMFLTAPKEVLEAAANFIQSREKNPPKVLQFYIHNQLQNKAPVVKELDPFFQILGSHYNLEKEWDTVNKLYFAGEVDVQVSWFGQLGTKRRTKVTLGLFDRLQNLIKVHIMLDHPEVPDYYLRFVLYHEALHKLYPPYLDDSGTMKIHHETFKKHERRFKEYDLARDFELASKKTWFAA